MTGIKKIGSIYKRDVDTFLTAAGAERKEDHESEKCFYGDSVALVAYADSPTNPITELSRKMFFFDNSKMRYDAFIETSGQDTSTSEIKKTLFKLNNPAYGAINR